MDKRFATPKSHTGRPVVRTNTVDRLKLSKMRSAMDEYQDEIEEEQKKFSELEAKYKEEQQKVRELAKRCAGSTEEADDLRKNLEYEKEKTRELEVTLNQKGRELAKVQQEMTVFKTQFELLNAQAMTLAEEKSQLSKRLAGSDDCSRGYKLQAESLRSDNEKIQENLSSLKFDYDTLKKEYDQISEILSNYRRGPELDTSMSPARFSIGENMADAVIDVQLTEKDEEIQALLKELDSLRTRLEEVDSQLVSKDQILNVEKEKNLLLANNNCELESILTQCRVDLDESQLANETFQSTVQQLTAERSNLQAELQVQSEELCEQKRALQSLEVEIKETHIRLEQAQEQDTHLQFQLELVKSELTECQYELANGMKELGENTRSLESTQNNLVICQEKLHEQRERSASLESTIVQQEANLIGVQSECNLLKEAVIRAEVDQAATGAVLDEKMLELQSAMMLLEELKCSFLVKESELLKTRADLGSCRENVHLIEEQQEQLKEEYDQKRHELQQTVEKVTSLVGEKEELMVCNENLERRIGELEWQLQTTRAELGMQITQLEAKRTELEEHIERIEYTLDSTNQELASAQESIRVGSLDRDQLANQLAISQDLVNRSQQEKIELQSRIELEQDSLRQASEQLAQAKEDITSLRDKLLCVEIETAERIRELDNDVQLKEQDFADVSRQLSETNTSLTEITQNLENKEQELAQCLESLDSVKSEHELSQKYVETLTSELTSTNKRLTTAESQLKEQETRESQCIQSLSEQREKSVQLEAKLEEIIQEKESLQEQLDSTASSLSECSTAFSDACGRITALEISLAEANEELTRAKEEVHGNETEAAEKIRALDDVVQSKEQELEDVSKQLSETKTSLTELVQSFKEKEQELAKCLVTLDSVKSDHELSQKNIETLTSEVTSSNERLTNAESRLKEQETRESQCIQSLSEQQEKSVQLEAKLEEIIQEKESLQEQLDSTASSLSECSTAFSDACARITSLEMSLAEANEELARAKEEVHGNEAEAAEKIRALDGVVQSKEQELEDVSRQLSEMKTSLTELAQSFKEKEQELSKCLESLDSVKSDLELSRKNIETLTSELTSSNDRLTNAESRLKEQETKESLCIQSLLVQQEHSVELEAKLEERIRETESLREQLDATNSSLSERSIAFSEASERAAALEVYRAAASEQLAQAKEDITILLNQLHGNETETLEKIQGLEDTVQLKEQDLVNVSRQLSETSSTLSELSQNLQDKEQELAKCLESLGSLKSDHELSQKNIETLTSELSSTNERLTSAESRLKDQETRESLCNNSLTQQQEHSAQLEAKLEESIRETESLRDRLNSTANSLSERSEAFNEASVRISALEVSLADADVNYMKVSESLGAANLKLEQVCENLARNKQILEERDLQLEDSICQRNILEQTLNDKELELSRTGIELVEVKQNLANLSQELAETSNNLNTKTQEVERASEEISRLNHTVNEMEEGLERLKTTLEARDGETVELQSKWQDVEGKLAEVESISQQNAAKVEESEQRLLAQTTEYNHLLQQLAFSEMELQASRTKRAQLEAALAEREEETRKRQDEFSAIKQDLMLLSVNFEDVTVALGEKTVELEKITENNAAIQLAEMKAIETELNKCKETLTKERIKYELFENQLELCNKEIKNLQDEGDELKHNNALLNATVVDLRHKNSQLIRENEIKERQCMEKIAKSEQGLMAKCNQKLEDGKKMLMTDFLPKERERVSMEFKKKVEDATNMAMKYKAQAMELQEHLQRQATSLAEMTGKNRHLEARLADCERRELLERQTMPPPVAMPTRQTHSSSSLSNWPANLPGASSTMPRVRSQNSVLSASQASSNTSTGSTRPLLTGIGNLLRMEDEEGEQFNSKFLDDLRSGRSSSHDDLNPGRLSELQRRNSLYPSHLKSSYPVETQFIADVKEDDIKVLPVVPNENDWLLGGYETKRPKDRTQGVQTRYKKPGPPTPGKNKAPGELTPRSALREHNQNSGLLDSGSKRKTSTPSRLKLMFTGRRSAVGQDSSFADENVSTTGSRLKRMSLFRRM